MYAAYDADAVKFRRTTLRRDMADVTSDVSQCILTVVQSPVCSNDLIDVGKTHYNVVTRDRAKCIGLLQEKIRNFGMSPTMLLWQARNILSDTYYLTQFINGTFTPPQDEGGVVTEERVRMRINQFFGAFNFLGPCVDIVPVDVPGYIIEHIAAFIRTPLVVWIPPGVTGDFH